MAIYSLDGADLDDVRQRWVLAEGTTLSTRGEPWNASVDIPGRFGVLPIAPSVLKSATVALKFAVFSWTDGRNGNRCKEGLEVLERNYQDLLRRLYAFGRLQTLQYTPKGSPAREAQVRPTSSVEPVFVHHHIRDRLRAVARHRRHRGPPARHVEVQRVRDADP